MTKLKRRTPFAVIGAVAAMLIVPATGQAATNFGSRLNHDPTESTCAMISLPAPSCTIVSYIQPSDPNGDPYSGGAPVDGVITKFRIRAYAQEKPGQVTFRLASFQTDPGMGADSAIASSAGTGPTITINPDESSSETPITEVPARLPVKKGQHLAIDTTSSIAAVYNSSGDKFSYVYSPPLVDGAGARGSNEVTAELLVAATIEPDADGDGFGDETQDKCPTQAATAGPCIPADTTAPAVSGLSVRGGTISYSLSEAATVRFQLARKLSGRRVGKRCVKKTAANQSKKKCPLFKNIGATFSGSGAPGKNSVSLPNGKKLKPGSYRLTMTATDAAGNTTTASTSFRIAKRKKKK